MADVKWIKITTDVFDDEKILMIESMPSADSIIVIWFKLLTFAGKQNNNGVFLMSNRIAYTDEMLASIFRRDVKTVRMALNIFQQFGMIEIVDNVITIPNWDKHQSLNAYEKKKERDRLYQAERRAKQLAIAEKSSDKSSDTSLDTSSYVAVTEEDIDKDKEEDKELDKDNRECKRTRTRFIPPTVEDVRAYCIERNNGIDAERFVDYYTANGWCQGRTKMKDWKAAVRNWERRDKKSAEEKSNNIFFDVAKEEGWI